jgi:hypothetical protein
MGWRVERLCIVAYSDRGLERVRGRQREREREKTSKSRRDYATMIWEQHDISKPIEIKYFKSDCFIRD